MDFEKLGLFYLGAILDPASRKPTGQPLLYDARDLTTHAVCVGMTGSGKTGLGIALLEEAAIDNVPALIIDPKGDLANLLLTFPDLKPSDFQPWIDEAQASRAGHTVEQAAADIAAGWAEGLKASGQAPERIARLREAVELAVYTPGSRSGRPLNILKSLSAPPGREMADRDALNDRVTSLVSGLLALLGLDADPLQSREHILISQIVNQAWAQGASLKLEELIRKIQAPGFQKIGVFDLDSFFPLKDRAALALRVNNLLASPAFAGWLEGAPLEIDSLLHNSAGRPRLSILSIAHLSDAERMFFVSLFLNELVGWTRRQSGTNSLRAILYMDEIFGYFPPTANPPSKRPMLTLLKQARAYGLGCVLSTQNPVDLDYKGLANAGSWFIGRLQTERDKARLLDGLENAGNAAGHSFDRVKFDKLLASLGQRTFLLNNVHEEEPVLFQTRWTLSYLAGPVSLSQIEQLTRAQKSTEPAERRDAGRGGEQASPASPAPPAGTAPGPAEPFFPVLIQRCYQRLELQAGAGPIYQARLWARAQLHFVLDQPKVDAWQSVKLLAPFPESGPAVSWEKAELVLDQNLVLDPVPAAGASFWPVPVCAEIDKNYENWRQSLQACLYQNHRLQLWSAENLHAQSKPGETEAQFRLRLAQAAREKRDELVQKLRETYSSRLRDLEEHIRQAKARVDREASQFQAKTFSTAISVGATVLGAFLGRKKLSATTVTRAASAMKSAGSAVRERGDVTRASETVEELESRRQSLEAELAQEVAQAQGQWETGMIPLTPLTIPPRKADLTVAPLQVAWVLATPLESRSPPGARS